MSVLAGLLLLATGGQAGADEAPQAKQAAGEEKVCRRSKETGSRVRAKRICHTRAEWAELDASAQQGLDRARAASRPGG